MKYAVVDIETTGSGGRNQKITEIAIYVFEEGQIVDEFVSLVNPERSIPGFITGLTGIDDHMVKDAPKFYEIAKKVHEITKDTVFVAHNVNFDYNIIAAEFQDLGAKFKRKKLCTVRLSRSIVPGLRSYSLGKLCSSLGIPLKDRHRAAGDAAATVKLLAYLMENDEEGALQKALNPRSMAATLPPLLDKKKVDNLPSSTGIYYFKNDEGKIIYVGKAKNIKARVMSHFYDKARKEQKMCAQTADLDYVETGSELVALLLESAEIKQHYPLFNRAGRRKKDGFGLFNYTDRSGVIHIGFGPLKNIQKPLITFSNLSHARNYVEKLCESHQLCPKYCHLQETKGACFHYQIKSCKGVCKQEESVVLYNLRVKAALKELQSEPKTYLIKTKGRNKKESAIVHVENGIYKGFGYISKNQEKNLNFEAPSHYDHFISYIKPFEHNSDTTRILNAYHKKPELESHVAYFENPSIDLMTLFG